MGFRNGIWDWMGCQNGFGFLEWVFVYATLVILARCIQIVGGVSRWDGGFGFRNGFGFWGLVNIFRCLNGQINSFFTLLSVKDYINFTSIKNFYNN